MIKLYAKGEQEFPEATIVYIPDGVDPTGLPVFIYLHGKGEHGDGTRKSLINYQSNEGHLPNWLSPKDEQGNIDIENGVFKGLKIGSEYYKPPFIICCPLTAKDVVLEGKQIPKYRTHIGTYFGTDSVALGGISFGGKGTLKARVAYPDLFKAFLPMAPAYLAKENLPECKAPMWSHHGAKDTVVHPNWSVWNTEYSAKAKPSLELTIKEDTEIKALHDLGKIAEDIDYEHLQELGVWSEFIKFPISDAVSIYTGKGHGVQFHVLHQKRVWGFLEHHLTGEEQPPVEENPLDQATDLELLVLARSIHTPIDLLTTIDNELELRAEDIIQRYKLLKQLITNQITNNNPGSANENDFERPAASL